MMDIKKRRRQVAWICFESYLSEEQRLQSIQILEHGFQVDGAINLMAYVAKICMELGIDLQNHNLLYSKFTKLMSEPSELLAIDPLALVHESEQNERVIVETPELNENFPLAEQENPACAVVFAIFTRFVLDYTPNKIELFTMLTELVADTKLQSQDLAGYIIQWINNPNNFAWSEALDQQTLTRLVHLVYMGLCEIMGPVAADDCFHRALTACEQRPEARVFPPSQFL